MKKIFKEHWIEILILFIYLVLMSFFLVRLHLERKKMEVIYEGGNFRIVSYNDAVYIINDDIYGGVHESKSESNQTCGENSVSH